MMRLSLLLSPKLEARPLINWRIQSPPPVKVVDLTYRNCYSDDILNDKPLPADPDTPKMGDAAAGAVARLEAATAAAAWARNSAARVVNVAWGSGFPECNGEYTLSPEPANGYPHWTKNATKGNETEPGEANSESEDEEAGGGGTTHYLFRSAKHGKWMVTDDKSDMAEGRGFISSSEAADLPSDTGLTWEYFFPAQKTWLADPALTCTKPSTSSLEECVRFCKGYLYALATSKKYQLMYMDFLTTALAIYSCIGTGKYAYGEVWEWVTHVCAIYATATLLWVASSRGRSFIVVPKTLPWKEEPTLVCCCTHFCAWSNQILPLFTLWLVIMVDHFGGSAVVMDGFSGFLFFTNLLVFMPCKWANKLGYASNIIDTAKGFAEALLL